MKELYEIHYGYDGHITGFTSYEEAGIVADALILDNAECLYYADKAMGLNTGDLDHYINLNKEYAVITPITLTTAKEQLDKLFSWKTKDYWAKEDKSDNPN